MGKLILTLGSSFEDVRKSVIEKLDEKSDLENVVIVPDRFSLIAELSVFKQKNIKCMFKTSVMPITKLATSLLEQIGISFKLVSSDEEGFLIRRAIQKVKKSFCCLGENLSPSMCDEIAKTIAQLKSCKITYEDLKIDSLPQSTAQKIKDISLIYQEYENLLVNSYDGAKMLATFEKNIEKMTFLANTNLFFVGFDSFTTQIFEIIKLLKNVTNQIVVGGYYHFNQKNKRIFEIDIFEKFKFFENKNDYKIEYISSSLLPWVEHINKNVYSNQQCKMENSGHVSIFSFENDKQEMKFVASEIVKNIKQNKMRFSDFAIAHSKLAELQDEFESILKENNINYYFDSSTKLSETTLPKFILAFYALALSNFEISEVKNFFSSIFVNEDLIKQSKDITMIQKYLIEKDSFKTLNVFVFDEDIEAYKQFKETAKTVIDLTNKVKDCVTVEDFVLLTKELINTFNCQEKIDNLSSQLENLGEIKEQKVNLQLIEKVKNCLGSIEKYLQDEKVNLKEFFDILSNAFSTKKVSTIPISEDCVFVGEPTESFFGTPKFLFVMGSTVEALPKTIFDSGLINDDNIDELKKVILINPTTRVINKRNKFKLLTLLSKPTEKLIVTYDKFSKDGKENLPSSFVLDLQNIFCENNTKLQIESISKNTKTVFDNYDNQTKFVLNNINSLPVAKEFVFKYAKDSVFDRKLINTVYEVLKDNNYVMEDELELFCSNLEMPKISSARQLYFKDNKAKISQLERYFSSPFKHFLSYGLCLQEIQTGDIQKNDIGNFMHYVAEEFILKNKDNFFNLTCKEVDDIVLKIIEKTKEQKEFYKFYLNKQNKTMLTYLTYEAKNLCGLICCWQQKSNFVPKHVEKSIYEENYFEKQNLSLAGRVDRIDEFENYFTILDYKTGKIEFNPKVVYTGQKLQLLIYADIYEKQTGKNCAGVFYFPIKNAFEMQDNVKLQGAFKKDETVINNLDTTINEENPASTMINATLNKSQEGEKMQFSAHTGNENLESMLYYAKAVCQNAIDEILDGHIDMLDENKISVFDAFEKPQIKKLKPKKIRADEVDFKNIMEKVDDKK